VRESRNVSSLLLIKLALIISNLDLFAVVLGHVRADMTLAPRDRWVGDRSDVELWKGAQADSERAQDGHRIRIHYGSSAD